MKKIKEIRILEPKIKEIKKVVGEPKSEEPSKEEKNIEDVVADPNIPLVEETKTDLKKLVLDSDEENKERSLEEVLRDVPTEKKEEKKDELNSGLYNGQQENKYDNTTDSYKTNSLDFEESEREKQQENSGMIRWYHTKKQP